MVLLVSGSCEKRGAAPPTEPPASGAAGEANDAPVVAEAESAQAGDEAEQGEDDEAIGCCEECTEGQPCTGCTLREGGECAHETVPCRVEGEKLFCIPYNEDDVWGGLTPEEVGEAFGSGGPTVSGAGRGKSAPAEDTSGGAAKKGP